jgi:DNA-binding MarR family transcriptional regulator
VSTLRLSGREAAIVRAIGFAEPIPGSEIQEWTHMELEDITEALNGLLAAGYVESSPFRDKVQGDEIPDISISN